MAESESILDVEMDGDEELFDKNLISAVMRLQATVRGCLLRRMLDDIRREYEDIVSDIEGPTCEVHWPKTVGSPVIKARQLGKGDVMKSKSVSKVKNKTLMKKPKDKTVPVKGHIRAEISNDHFDDRLISDKSDHSIQINSNFNRNLARRDKCGDYGCNLNAENNLQANHDVSVCVHQNGLNKNTSNNARVVELKRGDIAHLECKCHNNFRRRSNDHVYTHLAGSGFNCNEMNVYNSNTCQHQGAHDEDNLRHRVNCYGTRNCELHCKTCARYDGPKDGNDSLKKCSEHYDPRNSNVIQKVNSRCRDPKNDFVNMDASTSESVFVGNDCVCVSCVGQGKGKVFVDSSSSQVVDSVCQKESGSRDEEIKNMRRSDRVIDIKPNEGKSNPKDELVCKNDRSLAGCLPGSLKDDIILITDSDSNDLHLATSSVSSPRAEFNYEGKPEIEMRVVESKNRDPVLKTACRSETTENDNSQGDMKMNNEMEVIEISWQSCDNGEDKNMVNGDMNYFPAINVEGSRSDLSSQNGVKCTEPFQVPSDDKSCVVTHVDVAVSPVKFDSIEGENTQHVAPSRGENVLAKCKEDLTSCWHRDLNNDDDNGDVYDDDDDTVAEENTTVLISNTDAELQGHSSNPDPLAKLPDNKADLLNLKKTLTLELLWIQQAINSRKNYLKLKHQMG